MGKPNRILKLIKTGADGIYHLNRHCYYDNSFNGTYKETSCDYEGITIHPDNGRHLDNLAPNGYFYPIDHVLLYTDYVRNVVLNDRLRYTAPMMVPELFSNGLYLGSPRFHTYLVRDYIKSVQWKGAKFYYDFSGEYEQSNLHMLTKNGSTITFPLLPVPYAGTWEIRLWNTCMAHVALREPIKFMFGTSPVESEMKFIKFFYQVPPMLQHIEYKDKKPKILGDDNMLYDSVYCMMYDKCLRNMGYMKPPKIITLPDDNSCRDFDYNVNMRYIILRAYLEPQKTYYLRFQVMGTETSHFNYSTVEIVPKSVYDNPNRAEDVW